MLNRQNFSAKMKTLADFFNKNLGDFEGLVLKSYYDHLCKVSEDEFDLAIETAIATLKFFPSAKELRELCYGGKTDEQRAFERNSVNPDQKALPGYDDTEQCNISRQNFNLLAACMREGIPEEKILEWAKAGKSLRELLNAVSASKIQVDADVFSDIWQEIKPPTAQDYQKIARETIDRWKREAESN